MVMALVMPPYLMVDTEEGQTAVTGRAVLCICDNPLPYIEAFILSFHDPFYQTKAIQSDNPAAS